MGRKCAVTALLLVVLTGATSAVANNPSGSDVAAKSSNVKNAPFSADVITQYDRTLDNGGRIRRESRGKVYRDSQGRMRTESQMPALQAGSDKSDHHITITDPLQQVIIYLNPKNKTATVIHFGDAAPPPMTNAKQSKPKDLSKVRIGPAPPKLGAPQPEVGVPPVPSGQGSSPSNQPIPTRDSPAPRMDTSVLANGPGATVVPLGTKTIDGVSATGSRTTRTINPGTMGNDRAIVFISDTWTSTDLKVAVLTETDDGQAGHVTTKLANIVRSEPSPALFQIPPDYTVKENTSTASVAAKERR
jgi:hypothetical protein